MPQQGPFGAPLSGFNLPKPPEPFGLGIEGVAVAVAPERLRALQPSLGNPGDHAADRAFQLDPLPPKPAQHDRPLTQFQPHGALASRAGAPSEALPSIRLCLTGSDEAFSLPDLIQVEPGRRLPWVPRSPPHLLCSGERLRCGVL